MTIRAFSPSRVPVGLSARRTGAPLHRLRAMATRCCSPPLRAEVSSLLLGSGLPGGMMGSMMADLGPIQKMINKEREKKGENALTMDDTRLILMSW